MSSPHASRHGAGLVRPVLSVVLFAFVLLAVGLIWFTAPSLHASQEGPPQGHADARLGTPAAGSR